MAATEPRTDVIPMPKTLPELHRLLQRVMATKGLVSFGVSKDGVAITRLRELHEPILTEAEWPEESVSETLGKLEEITELPGTYSDVSGILVAMHSMTSRGYEPKVLVVPSDGVYLALATKLGGVVAVPPYYYLAGMRVEQSSLLAGDTFVVLGSVIGTYDLGAARAAVRVFITSDLGATNETDEDTEASTSGREDAATGEERP
jgi:hypothetical protein